MNETNTAADGLEQLLDLEEKVSHTIDLLRSARTEKDELLRENNRLLQERDEQAATIQKLEDRLGRLEKERDTVRERLQRLLEQVDSLTREKPQA